jgi:hypothetical protein
MQNVMIPESRQKELEALSKVDLSHLIDGLVHKDAARIGTCVEFVVADTQGPCHGRARAMMCRRLKHCALSEQQRQELVARITGRLAQGSFAQQFHEQLRLAMHLDRSKTFEVARECLCGFSKDPVRRSALWVLKHRAVSVGRGA